MSWFDEGTKRQRWRRRLLTVLGIFAVLGMYFRFKPLPLGVSVSSRAYLVAASNVRLLSDITGHRQGKPVRRYEVFAAMAALIAGAQRFVVLNFFLFHEYQPAGSVGLRDLTNEFTQVVLAKRRAEPTVPIMLIVDPISTVYGGVTNPQVEQLRQAGVIVVETKLSKLRDGNPAYGVLWRTALRWFADLTSGGKLVHPFAPDQKVSWRSWSSLLNFKANQRHVVVADRGNDVVSLVASTDPNTANALDTGLALEFVNGPWRELLASTQAVATFSGFPVAFNTRGLGMTPTTATSTVTLQLVSEGKIAGAINEQLKAAQAGDAVDVVSRALADRRVIRGLKEAAERGSTVRVILDPNRDARWKFLDGIPNLPVASELMLQAGKNVFVRWHVGQHDGAAPTFLLIRRQDGSASLLAGSAPLTKRALRDINLEADLLVTGSLTAEPLRQAAALFDQFWANAGGERFTAEYATYRDDALGKGVRYRLMERTGWNNY